MVPMEWRRPSRQLFLCPAHIHIWKVSLYGDSNLDRWTFILSIDEKARAERLLSPIKKHRFVCARAALRMILSLYCELPPDAIQFGYLRYGKPFLCQSSSFAPLEFSISHSEGMLLAVFSVSRAVGIDLECIQPLEGQGQTMERYFSSNDWETYRMLAEENRNGAFLAAWTRKEALGKALGSGLAKPGQRDYLMPGDEQPVPADQVELLDQGGWWWLRFQLDGDFIAAAAIMAEARPVISFWESSTDWLFSLFNLRVS